MSLSVPYVFRAALEEAPSLRLLGALDVNAAQTLSGNVAYELWRAGYRPGDHIQAPDPNTQLAAARLGLIIALTDSPPSASAGEACDLHTVETRVWSQTPLAVTEGGYLTHGSYLGELATERALSLLAPLTSLVLPILTSLELR